MELETAFLNKINEIYPENNAQKIEHAYFFAKAAHRGQKRQSGEDYIVHPTGVAQILVELGMDTSSIEVALLHDVIEDTPVTDVEIQDEFGSEVLMLVQGVTKLNKLNFKTREEEQAENLRRMFLAMSNDIRVIIIKLADRLNNMRTLGFKDEASQKRIAQETLDIYAPIASRLGISSIKGELEDLCLRYLHPEDYFEIADKINHTRAERQVQVKAISDELKKMLDELGIKGEVNGRPKHFYSIWRKLQKGKSFEQIYDLTALRVIVDSIKDCYAVLGAIHTEWKPLPGRFKDYISVPKSNMYQSLHTTVLTSFGEPFEIQIRTWEMHKIDELGIAAHWKYKQGNTSSSQTMDDKKLAWIRSVMELQNDASDSKEYLENVKMDLYADQVFVFTPKGDVFNLSNGATGVDFAYAVHSQVGNKCVGIKINSKIVPVSTKLENGDVVEVITSSTSKGPSRDWLKFVTTPSAKTKIKQFFKKETREENIKIGYEMMERAAKQRGYVFSELIKSQLWKEYIQQKYNAQSVDDVLAMIGYGELTAVPVVTRLIELRIKEIGQNQTTKDEIEQVKSKPLTTRKKNDAGVLISGVEGMKIKFSQCCSPLPGDDIIGYISKSRGVMIHRKDCVNVGQLEAERLIEASWPVANNEKFNAYIDVYAQDRVGLFIDVATLITNMRIPMISIDAKKDNDGAAVIHLCVEVNNVEALQMLLNKLRQVKNVTEVKRTSGV